MVSFHIAGTITGRETRELRTRFSKEISDVTGIGANRIIQCYNLVKDHLPIELFYDNSTEEATPK